MFYVNSNIDFKKIIDCSKTPIIVYDLKQLQYTLDTVTKLFSKYPCFKLSYAAKASYNHMYLNMFSRYGFGCDVAGVYEYNIIKKFPFKFITTTSPYYSVEDMQTFASQNIVMDLNSKEQLKTFCELKVSKKVGLRLRIEFPEWAGTNLGTYGNNSRFGMDVDKELLDLIQVHEIDIVSIHTHTGQMTPEMLIYKIEYLLTICKLFNKVEIINLGGGGFHLLKESNKLDAAMQQAEILIEKFNDNNNREVSMIFEPGGAMTVPFGYLITTVISKQRIRSRIIVTVNSSAWNILPWSIYEVKTIDNKSGKLEEVIIAGCSLFEGYFFGINDGIPKIHEIAEITVGDRLLFFASGGYTYTNSRTFNGIPLPAELVIN